MVKKLTSEEFCSVAHRQAYHDEQEQLALARLLEDQQRRKPARRPLQKSKDKSKAPEFADFLFQKIGSRTISSKPWVSNLDLSFSPVTLAPTPASTLVIPRSGLAAAEFGGDLISPFGTASVEEAMSALAQSQALLPPSPPITSTPLQASPQSPATIELEEAIPVPVAPERPQDPSFAPIPLTGEAIPTLPGTHLRPWQHLPIEVMDFTRTAGAQLPFDLALRYQPILPEPATLPTPHGEALDRDHQYPAPLALAPMAGLPGLADGADVPQGWLPEAPPANLRAPNTLPFVLGSAAPYGAKATPIVAANTTLPYAVRLKRPWVANPIEAPVPNLPSMFPAARPVRGAILGPSADSLRLRAPEVVCFAGSIQRLFARPRPVTPRSSGLTASGEIPQGVPKTLLMAQSRSARELLSRTLGKCEPYTTQFPHPDTFLRSVAGNWVAADSLFAFNEPIPAKARIASVRRSTLSVVAKTFRASRQAGISVHPDPAIQPPVMREWSAPTKLPVPKPLANLRILPARSSHSALSALGNFTGAGYQLSWQAMQRRWHEAPNDLRWIAMAVPLVIGLIWFAESPSIQHGMRDRLSSVVPNVGAILNTSLSGDSFEGLKQNIQRRAAVELSDDFRQGLGEWAGVGDWSRGWTYDPAGFIRPRNLALYTPSLGLEDYRFEFLGAIERKALSWVFRAADVKNYYAARLEMTRGGPLPTVELVRYAVMNGRPGPKKSIPLPMQTRQDTIYRVRVDVRGSDFVTTVQGQIVDVFSDDRLARGGVGFFSEPGEDARLRWVEVSHQYDMLGRLCAYLVPYNVSNSNVRSAP